MIFFIMGVLILPLYQTRKWMGWLTIAVLSGVSFAVTMVLCLRNKLGPYVFDNHYEQYNYYVYSRSYTRAPVYFVGIVAAWLLNELESKGFTRESRPLTLRARTCASLIACTAGALLLACIFIPVTDYGRNANSWDNAPVASALYLTFSRTAWAVSCAAITLLCYYGYMPIVDGILSAPIFTPLARLTYGAYLCHPLMFMYDGATAMQFYTFTPLSLFSRFLSVAALACLGSMALWILVERPCMTIFSPSKKAKPKQSPSRENSALQQEASSKSAGRSVSEVSTHASDCISTCTSTHFSEAHRSEVKS